MEIKKADSKGRVSGFEPGKYYSVVRGSTGTGFALNQLHEGGYTGTRNEPHGVVQEAVAWDEGYWLGINGHTGPGNPYRESGEVSNDD